MKRRFDSFDGDSIRRRKELGEVFDRTIGRSTDDDDSRWICPVFMKNPEPVCKRLRGLGFDATVRSRMLVVPPADQFRVAVEATANWSRITFLPWYPDLTENEVRRLARSVEPYLIEEVSNGEFPSEARERLFHEPAESSTLAGEAV